MKKLRDILGYVLGGLLFMLLIPAVMWFASGRPAIAHVSVLRTSVAVLMMLGGLAMHLAGSTRLAALPSHDDDTSYQRRTPPSSRLRPGIRHLPPPHTQVLRYFFGFFHFSANYLFGLFLFCIFAGEINNKNKALWQRLH